MKQSKLVWLFEVAALCLVLFVIINARLDRVNSVIFGGADGAYVTTDSMVFLDPAATPEPVEDAVIWPNITLEQLQNERQYAIVNDKNLLSAAFQPEDVAKISGTNMMFDANALPYLEDMLQALRDAGFTVYVAGAYRSYSYQEKLFNGKASQIALGMDPPVDDYLDPRYQEAVAEARTITMYPGSSEHQLGLAVDLMDKAYYRLNYNNMNQDFFNWLDEHCAEYGFIKRYPTKKLLLTGWDEPYHYRYVGVEAATFIMEHGICYEEFYAHYDPDFEF